MTKIINAIPHIFYGLHFQEGVAEYKDMPDGSMMYYINGDTCKKMDKSFQGKPVFVLHADNVDFANVQEADGLVVRSFFNKSDGNHWSEFIVYTDEGLKRIQEGWKLSNAYTITSERGSGTWHGVDYDREVIDAEYEHLAIVPNPRYSDSIILNAEDFKQYNIDKEAELVKLSNSKGSKGMFKLFKKEAVKNSDDLKDLSVVLPVSKVEKTVTQLVNEADEAEKSKGLANMDDKVEMENGDAMSVKELMNFYSDSCKKKKENEEKDLENEDEKDLENEDEKDLENMDKDEKKKENEEEKDLENEEEKKKENEDEDEDQDKVKKNSMPSNMEEAKLAVETAQKNFMKLKNAGQETEVLANSVDLGQDKVERGNSRYGSK